MESWEWTWEPSAQQDRGAWSVHSPGHLSLAPQHLPCSALLWGMDGGRVRMLVSVLCSCCSNCGVSGSRNTCFLQPASLRSCYLQIFFPLLKKSPPPLLLSSSNQRPGGASEAAAEVQGSSHTEPEGCCCAFPLLGHLLNTSQSLLQSLCCSPSAPRQAQPCLTASALGEREQQRVLIKAFSAVKDLHKPC